MSVRIQITTHVACPADVLWDYIEEPEKQKLWMKGLLANESTSPGDQGVGSTFRMKIQEGMKVAEFNGLVTAREKPNRMEVTLDGGSFPAGSKLRVDYRLAEAGGKTRLDYTCVLEGGKFGFFMRLLLPLCKIFATMQAKSFMKTLKRLAESHAASSAGATAK
jgi:carbon monoxide dehydrogenase subunit G